jgi:hypothetical protein
MVSTARPNRPRGREASCGRPGRRRGVLSPVLRPEQCRLVICGDIDSAKTRAMVERYFGNIARDGPIQRPVETPVALATELRLMLEDVKATQPELVIAWRDARSLAAADRSAIVSLELRHPHPLFRLNQQLPACVPAQSDRQIQRESEKPTSAECIPLRSESCQPIRRLQSRRTRIAWFG